MDRNSSLMNLAHQEWRRAKIHQFRTLHDFMRIDTPTEDDKKNMVEFTVSTPIMAEDGDSIRVADSMRDLAKIHRRATYDHLGFSPPSLLRVRPDPWGVSSTDTQSYGLFWNDPDKVYDGGQNVLPGSGISADPKTLRGDFDRAMALLLKNNPDLSPARRQPGEHDSEIPPVTVLHPESERVHFVRAFTDPDLATRHVRVHLQSTRDRRVPGKHYDWAVFLKPTGGRRALSWRPEGEPVFRMEEQGGINYLRGTVRATIRVVERLLAARVSN